MQVSWPLLGCRWISHPSCCQRGQCVLHRWLTYDRELLFNWLGAEVLLRWPSPWRKNQVSCLTAVCRRVQDQRKRFLVWKQFYIPAEGRFSGILPSHFAFVVSINAHIIADILQGECKTRSVPSNISISDCFDSNSVLKVKIFKTLSKNHEGYSCDMPSEFCKSIR